MQLSKTLGNVSLPLLHAAAASHEAAFGIHRETATLVASLHVPCKNAQALVMVRKMIKLAHGEPDAVASLEVFDMFYAEKLGVISAYNMPESPPIPFVAWEWPSAEDEHSGEPEEEAEEISGDSALALPSVAVVPFADLALVVSLPIMPRRYTPATMATELAKELGDDARRRFPELHTDHFLEHVAAEIGKEAKDKLMHWMPSAPEPLVVYKWMKPSRQLEWLLYRQSLSQGPMSKNREDFPTFLLHYMEIDKKSNALASAKKLWSMWTGIEFGPQSALSADLRQKILSIHYGRNMEDFHCRVCTRPLKSGHLGILCDTCACNNCRHCGEVKKEKEEEFWSCTANIVTWEHINKLRRHLALKSLTERRMEGLSWQAYRTESGLCCDINFFDVGSSFCETCKPLYRAWDQCNDTMKQLKLRTWSDMETTITKLNASLKKVKFCDCAQAKAHNAKTRKLNAHLEDVLSDRLIRSFARSVENAPKRRRGA